MNNKCLIRTNNNKIRQEEDDRFIVLNPYGSLLSFNKVGYEVLKLCDGFNTESDIVKKLYLLNPSNKLDFNKFYLTKEFLWMNENAHKYGFILRYPKDKENITGYSYEPWHYRYVGKEVATYIKKHNSTYEEYYYEFLDL